jgi:hypothetical protein
VPLDPPEEEEVDEDIIEVLDTEHDEDREEA